MEAIVEKKIRQLISKGEGIEIEFKECLNAISNSVYETICGFLNAKGGHVFLGIKDNGDIIGIGKESSAKLQLDFANSINNPSKISPQFCLCAHEVIIDGKIVLHIFVPESSQVHRCGAKIFIRNVSGDFDITNRHSEVTNLYIKKQSSYSENKIFPAITMEDLRIDLIEKARKLSKIQDPNHLWQQMTDMELLKTSSLYQKDPMTGEEGFTLAAILLLGKDETISTVAPAFRIDLIKRVNDITRYDDRVDLRTNLMDAYERAMAFIKKHLPDPFFIENGQRVSLRDSIFREIIANIIVHKEYLGAQPTKLIIERNKVITENSNKPYINGIVDLSNLVSHPKNPNIAKFFRQLGLVEELGSGVLKLYRFCKKYTGHDPEIIDDNVFSIILSIDCLEFDTPHDE
jgi:ATP-dependent DNA helicase RecG